MHDRRDARATHTCHRRCDVVRDGARAVMQMVANDVQGLVVARFGNQWPLLLAGTGSVGFGIAYVIASTGTDPMLTMLAIYAAGGGVDFVVQAWLLAPCFASPFRDAGYDVSDYLRIAPRYGSNDDMAVLVAAARERGIRVLLDLVAGHTSVAHEWFQHSANDPSDHRYVWSDRPGEGDVASPGPPPGYYLKNFFEAQPALNFGYARTDPEEPWRQPVDAPGPQTGRGAALSPFAIVRIIPRDDE